MGVTFHFEGRAKGDDGRDAVIAAAKRFAGNNGWPCFDIDQHRTVLKRVIDEENVDYVGPTVGVQLQLHEDSESLRLEFDCNNFCQDYCKTRFAPVHAHVAIVELLRMVQPLFFFDLTVTDEGEYFEWDDRAKLQNHLNRCFEAKH